MKMVELVGFDDLDDETLKMVKEKMEYFSKKYDRVFPPESIQDFKIYLKKIKKGGKKDVHELTLTLNTTLGDYRVEKNGWELLSLIDEVESVLENQIRKEKEKKLKEKEGRN